MTLPLLLALLVGYLVLAGLFVMVAWPLPGRARWLGLAAVAAAAPVFTWIGSYSEQVAGGQCYSNVVTLIGNSVSHTTLPKELAESVRALPLKGAETDCSEVEAAAKRLPLAEQP
jgi:hypothetical protein